ncbi:hypothetical protein ACEPPN_019146 [Leptodophora sp. 'Broadleaf-Isolate-01']
MKIKELEERLEQLRPKKRRKVRTSPNSKFVTTRAIKEAQIAAGERQIESLESESGGESDSTISLLIPTGALDVAYRKCCIRYVRLCATIPSHDCNFNNPKSKKCAYCAEKKSRCNLLPWFVAEEYVQLVAALEAEDKEAIVTAAESIDSALLVAAASAPKNAREVSLALLEETRALRREIAGLASSQVETVLILDRLLTTVSAVATKRSREEDGGEDAPPTKRSRRSRRSGAEEEALLDMYS